MGIDFSLHDFKFDLTLRSTPVILSNLGYFCKQGTRSLHFYGKMDSI